MTPEEVYRQTVEELYQQLLAASAALLVASGDGSEFVDWFRRTAIADGMPSAHVEEIIGDLEAHLLP